jgi:hypothetical protein
VGSDVSERERDQGVPIRDVKEMGLGLLLLLGRNGAPWLLFFSPFLSLFLFWFSCFYFYLLLKSFKTIQTSFINFVKFIARF